MEEKREGPTAFTSTVRLCPTTSIRPMLASPAGSINISRAHRTEACQFISDLGHRLGFPYRTLATSRMLFHWFYVDHPESTYPHLDIALTAVLVASKIEETYKKIRQILATAFLILHPNYQGDDIEILEDHRRRVVQYEEVLLEVIDYNFCVPNHFATMAKLAKAFAETRMPLLELAWLLLDDLHSSPVIIQYPAHFVALATLVEARSRLQLSVQDLMEWAELADIDSAAISEIRAQIKPARSSEKRSSPRPIDAIDRQHELPSEKRPRTAAAAATRAGGSSNSPA